MQINPWGFEEDVRLVTRIDNETLTTKIHALIAAKAEAHILYGETNERIRIAKAEGKDTSLLVAALNYDSGQIQALNMAIDMFHGFLIPSTETWEDTVLENDITVSTVTEFTPEWEYRTNS